MNVQHPDMAKTSMVTVRVPATSANIGPGFDTLGLALSLHLTCTLRRADVTGLQISVRGTDREQIPVNDSNLIFRTFQRLAGDKGENLVLEIQNDIPLGRGLGSSAAAIVAGIALANEWCGLQLTNDQMIAEATRIEGHPDNVAAALLGGLVLSCQFENGPVASLRSTFPPEIGVVVVVPEFQLSTEKARAVLPENYSRRDAVFNLQRLGLLISSLRDRRFDLFSEAMRDRLHQPYRAPFIPGLKEALALTGVPGLLGVALSGAGPSVLAFCHGNPGGAGDAIVACFSNHEIRSHATSLAVDQQGLWVERSH